MNIQFLMAAFALGGAALALWSYVRWPGAAPATFGGAILRMAFAWATLQIGATLIELALEMEPAFAVPVVVASVVPTLSFAFLAALWFMKLCADRMRGAY